MKDRTPDHVATANGFLNAALNSLGHAYERNAHFEIRAALVSVAAAQSALRRVAKAEGDGGDNVVRSVVEPDTRPEPRADAPQVPDRHSEQRRDRYADGLSLGNVEPSAQHQVESEKRVAQRPPLRAPAQAPTDAGNCASAVRPWSLEVDDEQVESD